MTNYSSEALIPNDQWNIKDTDSYWKTTTTMYLVPYVKLTVLGKK